jgi:hypothetical protein
MIYMIGRRDNTVPPLNEVLIHFLNRREWAHRRTILTQERKDVLMTKVCI